MSPETRQPLVTIVLPVPDNADGLPAALPSILNQTFPDFELIVVDDGSTDTGQEFLAGLTDPRVVIIRHPERYGAARAWNTGISAARGELVGFIASGDSWEREKLEEQVALFARLPQEYGVVYSDAWEITPAGNRAYWHSPDMTGPDLLNAYATDFVASGLGTGPLLVRRSCLDMAGPFDEQLRCFSDTDMIIRLQRVCRFHHIPKPLCCRRSRQDRAAGPFEQCISQLLLLQKYRETLADPVFLTQQLDRIGRNLRQAQERIPAIPGQPVQEPEQGHFREPVREP